MGASLHNVLIRLKAQPQLFPSIDLSYSSTEPLLADVVLTLPTNGIRLRFDGPDQRLRLIEVLNFAKASLTYKGYELVRPSKSANGDLDQGEGRSSGPLFRHVYNRLFGPSYPGEYYPPRSGRKTDQGTYILSYPGIAFSFPLLHTSWSEHADFVTLLSSPASSAASSLAIFQGSSWSEARASLCVKQPPFPRSIARAGRNKDLAPDEIEEARILGQGRIEFLRQSTPAFLMCLGETTPQDLIAEFGPPDAIYRKNDTRIAIHADNNEHGLLQKGSDPRLGSGMSLETGRLRATNDGEDSDAERLRGASDGPLVQAECFFNYFHHGFDALLSFPSGVQSPPFPGTEPLYTPPPHGSELRVTKILLHGNVPGSYPFNRHRRCRWSIQHASAVEKDDMLTSERPFSEISEELKSIWQNSYCDEEEKKAMQRGMVLNRGWGESPESSVELLGGWEDNTSLQPTIGSNNGSAGAPGLGNTQLFGFPGLLFEVLKSGSVSCLTVY